MREVRRSGSALSEAALKAAEEHNIPVEPKPITVATYILDPEYAQNATVMQAVVDVLNAGMPEINAAIAKAGLKERVILQAQEGNSTTVTNEQTLAAIFRLPRETAKSVVRLFGTLAVGKGKYALPPGKEGNLSAPLDRTSKLLNLPEFRDVMQGAAKRAKAKTKRAA